MSELGLHPTLDNLWTINDAAALHDFAHKANAEFRKDLLSVVYQPETPKSGGLSYLAVDDRQRDSQVVIAFASLSAQENPMFVEVMEMTEDGIETLEREPILARVAIKWSGELAGVEIEGAQKTGASLHCTPDKNILTYLEDATKLEPIMGEYDGYEYREIDKRIRNVSCIPQLLEYAESLM